MVGSEQILSRGRAFAMRQMMALLARSSDQGIINITRVAEVFARRPRHKNQISWVRGLFEDGHPSIGLARRIIKEADPKLREGVLINLFMRATWDSDGRRMEFEKANGFAPPQLIVVSPTMRCNLRCTGCYAGKYDQSEELSTEDIDRIVTQAKEMGTYFVTISGGEPFIRRDLLDIFRKHKEVAFHVYTNGTLIDRDMAKTFAELGNIAPAISVEGFQEETDGRRGPGTYDKVMWAMEALREERCIFGFSATVTRNNADLLMSEAFLDHYLEMGAYFGWFFVYIPIGKAPSLDLMPTPDQRNRLRQRTIEIRRTRPIFVGDFWNDGGLTGGCMAGGRLYLHINHKGDVEPCVFAHFAVDNIHNKSLREALDSPFFHGIRSRLPLDENLLTPCMIIDKPEVLRDLVKTHGAYSTDGGGESLLSDLKDHLDAYSEEYGKLVKEPWVHEYQWVREDWWRGGPF